MADLASWRWKASFSSVLRPSIVLHGSVVLDSMDHSVSLLDSAGSLIDQKVLDAGFLVHLGVQIAFTSYFATIGVRITGSFSSAVPSVGSLPDLDVSCGLQLMRKVWRQFH